MARESTSQNLSVIGLDVALTDAFESITKSAEAGRRSRYDERSVLTGFKYVDEALVGILPGELVVVSGKAGVGKTAFALNVAVNAARTGTKVLLFCPAHDPIQIATRMIVADSRVNVWSIAQGYASEADWGVIAESSNRLATLDLRICSSPWITPFDVLDIVQDYRSDDERCLVVFDGLDWMVSDSEMGFRSQSGMVSWSASQMKKVARSEGVCVLATIPLALESDSGSAWPKSPYSECALESFQGAQDAADALVLLDRDTSVVISGNDESRLRGGTADLYFIKNKRTPATCITLAFVRERVRFMDFVDGNSAKCWNDRVGDIALGLGWDRARVVDALESLEEEVEKKVVFSSYEEMVSAVNSFSNPKELSAGESSAHLLIRSEVELSPIEARRRVCDDPGLRVISIRSSTDWDWLYVLERWDFRCASCGSMIELDLEGEAVTNETSVKDRQEWAFEIGRLFINRTPNWYAGIQENDLASDVKPPEGERQCPHCGKRASLSCSAIYDDAGV